MNLFELDKITLTDEMGRPNGNSAEILIRYLSLNTKLIMSRLAAERIDEVEERRDLDAPKNESLVSKPTTQADIESDWSRYWSMQLHDRLHYHRKQWEHSFVCQTLFEHGMLREGKKGLGLACGLEPMPSYFAACGCEILASDQPPSDDASRWSRTNQHTQSLENLYFNNLIDRPTFEKNCHFEFIDMTNLPEKFNGEFDFCWSICAIEHVGSIKKGLEVVKNSLKLLKPGGICIHTTEFNIFNAEHPIDNWPSVLFSKNDIIQLGQHAERNGCTLLGPDFSTGDGFFDKYIDIPPYPTSLIEGVRIPAPCYDPPHLKMLIDGFPSTCYGIIIKKNQ